MAGTKNTGNQRTADSANTASGSPQTQDRNKDNPSMQGGAPMGNAGKAPSQTGQSGDAPTSKIREHMNVVASCGTRVGVVDHVDGQSIKLTKNDSKDGQHHFIPTAWVDRVDNEVHLKKNSKETEQGWKSDAASCSGGSCGM